MLDESCYRSILRDFPRAWELQSGKEMVWGIDVAYRLEIWRWKQALRIGFMARRMSDDGWIKLPVGQWVDQAWQGVAAWAGGAEALAVRGQLRWLSGHELAALQRR
jgi:hypothetical protein